MIHEEPFFKMGSSSLRRCDALSGSTSSLYPLLVYFSSSGGAYCQKRKEGAVPNCVIGNGDTAGKKPKTRAQWTGIRTTDEREWHFR